MLPINQNDPNKLFNYTFTTNTICNKCGKPFIYLGDIPYGGFIKDFEPYCTCRDEKRIEETNNALLERAYKIIAKLEKEIEALKRTKKSKKIKRKK